MIFHEVAIEPAYLSNWDRVRLIVDQCGFDSGRLISEFPKNWQWRVVEACAQCPPLEKKRIEEYLRGIKPKLFRNGRSFIDTKPWVLNAKREHERVRFHVVVTNERYPELIDFIEGAEICAEHEKWKCTGDDVILRTARQMGDCAATLLAAAQEVVFVDPNFEVKASYGKPLCEFIRLALEGSQVRRMEYHLEYDSTRDHFVSKLESSLKPFIEAFPACNLQFIRWKSFERPKRDAMHPRYILTDKGGLRFDYGLCEGNMGESTDVHIIPKSGVVYNQRWTDFSAKSTSFQFVDGFVLTPQGVFELAIESCQFQRSSTS